MSTRRKIVSGREARKKAVVRITLVGSVVNLALLTLKFVAGILGRSAAMIADAVHSLSDFVTDIIVLVFIRISSKPRDESHKYGHGKYETLATVIIGVVLCLVGLKLMWDGGNKVYGFFFKGEQLASPGYIALIAALVSIVVKEILFRYTVIVGRRENSQSVIANAWHHRSDAFSSLGTALGIGGAILLGPNWAVLDPIAAVVVSVFIVKVALELLIPAINELLEKSLPADVEAEILNTIMMTPGVSDPHNLRTRRIGNNYAIEIHIRVDGAMSVCDAHDLTKLIETRLRERFGQDTHVNIHVEPVK
jgi:cation diffusion facilitator family transporter